LELAYNIDPQARRAAKRAGALRGPDESREQRAVKFTDEGEITFIAGGDGGERRRHCLRVRFTVSDTVSGYQGRAAYFKVFTQAPDSTTTRK